MRVIRTSGVDDPNMPLLYALRDDLGLPSPVRNVLAAHSVRMFTDD